MFKVYKVELHLIKPFSLEVDWAKRLGLRHFLFFSFLLSMAGCEWNEPPPRDTLVFALGESPKTLDPRFTTGATGQRVSQLVFSSLVQLDEELKLKGDLASHWKLDGLKYSFFLKPQILFHNGSRLTNRDILFSFNEFRKDSSLFATPFKNIHQLKVNYNFEKGGELTILLKKHNPTFLLNLRMIKILPAKLMIDQPDFFRESPIGTGPFQVSSMSGHSIILKKNESFYGRKAKIKNIHFKIIKDANTRFLKMYKGQVDIVQSDIPFSKIPFFREKENFQVITSPGLSTTYLLLNNRHPLLKEKEFREALFDSIDKDVVIQYALGNLAIPALSLIPSHLPHFNKNLNEKEEEPSLQTKNFKIFEDKTLTLKTSNNFQALENGQMIAAQLKKKGLNVKLKSFEWGTYYGDIKAGRFDLAIMKWVGVLSPDILRNTLHSREYPPGRNRGYFHNSEFDKIIDEAFEESQPEKRRILYNKAQEIVFEEKPILPLWHEKQVAIIHKRVKNYVLPLDGSFSSLTKVFKENE